MTVRRRGTSATDLAARGVGAAGARVTRAVLGNGMVVVVRESRGAPVVALTLLTRVGSRDETGETNGATALLGRVVTKGTRTRSAVEIARTVEDAGGDLGTGADQEYAELRLRGLARAWRTLLGLAHDVATAPSLSPHEVDLERAALAARIRAIEDQPFQVATRLLNRLLHGDHPLGLPPSGEVATVERLGRDQLTRHFERFWTPDRMVLAVAGDVEAEAVLAEAARGFGAGASGPGVSAPLPPVVRPERRRLVESRPTAQAHVVLGVPAPPAADPDHVALKVLDAVLGGGMSGRLFRSLRDEAGLAYAVGSAYPTRLEASRLVAYLGTAPAGVARAESGLRRELARVVERPVPDDELARARAGLAGSFALDLRTTASWSFALGFYELIGLGHGYVTRYPALIGAVTPADVERVARRWLVDPSVVTVGPASAVEP